MMSSILLLNICGLLGGCSQMMEEVLTPFSCNEIVAEYPTDRCEKNRGVCP